MVRASVDDIGAVIPDVSGPRVMGPIFSEQARSTRLELRPSKCEAMPLSVGTGARSVRVSFEGMRPRGAPSEWRHRSGIWVIASAPARARNNEERPWLGVRMPSHASELQNFP